MLDLDVKKIKRISMQDDFAQLGEGLHEKENICPWPWQKYVLY